MADQVHPGSLTPASSPSAPTFDNTKMPGATMGPLPPPATYSKPHRHRRGGLAGCCCCLFASLCSLLILVLFLAGVTILVLWLVLRPIYLPTYSLDVTQIPNLSVGANSTLNANLDYIITANNPNRKIGIYYDVIDVDTTFEAAQVVHQTSVPAFYQGHQNVTIVSSVVNVNGFPLSASAASAFSSQIQANRILLNIRGDAQVRVKIGVYKSPDFWVSVDCDVVVGVSPGALISKSCKLSRRS